MTEGLSIAIIKKKWIQPGGYLCDGCDAFFASERVKVFIKHCLMECRKFDKLGKCQQVTLRSLDKICSLASPKHFKDWR